MPPIPDEPFSKAEELWDLDRLYRDLATAKQEPLTPGEKEYLRALLLGHGPKDIAKILHRSANGVRVALSHLYKLVDRLLNVEEGKVGASNIRDHLEQAGYRRRHETSFDNNAATSECYIDRPPIESNCYSTILQPGSLIRIKAPQQMGKTLLLDRILNQAEQKHYRTVKFSLRLLDRHVFTNLGHFLQVFCQYVGHTLGLPDRVTDLWTPTFGSKINCKAYFEEYLLPALDSPLVLGLDDVDLIFEYPDISTDFLGLLRAWYEEGRNSGIWQNLRLILVHSTEVYVPLDSHQSPFNVGLAIDLREFRLDEVWELVRLHHLDWSSDQIATLFQLVGGHPDLVTVALSSIAQQNLTLDQLTQQAPTESGPFAGHLRRHLFCLERHPDLADAMTQIVATSEPIRLNTAPAFKLHSMGLVHLEGNRVRIRNDLYRQYFRDRLTPEVSHD
jgi:DNA-binding CsgD family transcriptional regulator